MNTTTAHTTLTARAAAVLAALALLLAAAAPAHAAKYTWYGVPSISGASGSAIIDANSSGYWSSSARGRVYINSGAGCAKVQYAPFAVAALDGGWNSLPTVCGGAYQSWSDTYHQSFNGFKFRICKNGSCGSVRYVYF